MLAVSIGVYVMWRGGGLHVALLAPYRQWQDSWHALRLGNLGEAAVIIAPSAVPVGLLLGAGGWRARGGVVGAGGGGRGPPAPAAVACRGAAGGGGGAVARRGRRRGR